MFATFKNHYQQLIAEYNKNNSGNPLPVMSDDNINELFRKIDTWSIYTLNYFDIDFHLTLNHLTNSIYKIIIDKSYKAKYLKEVYDDIVFLNKHIDKDKRVEVMENYIATDPFNKLYDQPLYVKMSILKHCDLMLSKTIDYIPDNKNNLNNVKSTLEMLSHYRTMLEYFIDQGHGYWTLAYTETNRFIPIQFKYLNHLDGLGKRIDEWTDAFQETEICKYLNENGYDVFGGWGDLSGKLAEKSAEPMLPETKETAEELPKIVLSEISFRNLVSDCATCSGMFTHNPLFKYTNPVHRHMFARMMAMCVFHYTENHNYTESQIRKVMIEVKNALTKHRTRFITRRDRKHWFDNMLASDIKSIINAFHKVRGEYFATSIGLFTYDRVVGDDIPAELLEKHHKFLAVTYNKIFYGAKPLDNGELEYLLNRYQNYIMPRLEVISEEDRRWLYRLSVNFALDIKNDELVNKYYEDLKSWFTVRHTTEENNAFYDKSLAHFLFMSYNDKETLVNKLTKEPIDIVSYGGSKEIYNKLLELCTRDLETPVLDKRVQHVDITDGKLEVKNN